MLSAYKTSTRQLGPEIVEQMRLGKPVLVDSFGSPNTILMPMTVAEAEDYEYTKYLRESLAEAEEFAKNDPNAWFNEEAADAEIAKLHS